jgi:hypothetical protein
VQRARAETRTSLAAVRLAAAWGASLVVVFVAQQFLELRRLEPQLGRAAAAEARSLAGGLAGPVQIGLGATQASLGRAGLAAELAIAGQPHWFDAAALFDFARAGVDPPPASADLVRSCGTRYWLIPHGEAPFALRGLYAPHAAVFDSDFREAFARSHALVESGAYFDVWECRER